MFHSCSYNTWHNFNFSEISYPQGDYIRVRNFFPRLNVEHAFVCGGPKVVNTSQKALVPVSTIQSGVAWRHADKDGALGTGVRPLRVQRSQVFVMIHFEWRHQCWGYCNGRTDRLLIFSDMAVQFWSHIQIHLSWNAIWILPKTI